MEKVKVLLDVIMF